jgi:hypothetical protein
LGNYQRLGSDPAWQTNLLQDLNTILAGCSIYDTQRFAGVILRSEIQQRLSQPDHGGELLRLNWLLLEDAYPQLLSRKPYDWWQTTVDGAYAKLDDVSFWTALAHLLCVGLVGTALLNLFNIDGTIAKSFTFRSRHFFAWAALVIGSWVIYFFSIYNTTDKGTFFSSTAPETRLGQILEGLLPPIH